MKSLFGSPSVPAAPPPGPMAPPVVANVDKRPEKKPMTPLALGPEFSPTFLGSGQASGAGGKTFLGQ